MGTHIDEILAREADLRAKLLDPDVTEIDMPAAFFARQVGLHTIMCDPMGRIWDTTASPIRMIFDPAGIVRTILSGCKKEKIDG